MSYSFKYSLAEAFPSSLIEHVVYVSDHMYEHTWACMCLHVYFVRVYEHNCVYVVHVCVYVCVRTRVSLYLYLLFLINRKYQIRLILHRFV